MVGLLAAIIVGAIAGSLASQLVPGLRLGLLGDTLVGIAGVAWLATFPVVTFASRRRGHCVDYCRNPCCNRRSRDLSADRTTNRSRETRARSRQCASPLKGSNPETLRGDLSWRRWRNPPPNPILSSRFLETRSPASLQCDRGSYQSTQVDRSRHLDRLAKPKPPGILAVPNKKPRPTFAE